MASNRCLQVLVIVGQGGIMVVIEHERSGEGGGGGTGHPPVLKYLLGSVDSFSK
jgi:hypothetical protein